MLPAGERRSPVAGRRHKGDFPCSGRASRPGPRSAGRRASWEQAKRATQANNYWSASTNAGNPNNAWNVNFNNGNPNNNNKTNKNYVRAVRTGS
jgi:hypothetical protein